MTGPNLAKNSAWLILSRFGAQGLAVIFTVLLARRLGNVGFGEYAFVAALVFVANALTTFGTDMLLIREIAAKNDLSRLPSALLIQLLLSGIFIAVAWLGGGYLPNQSGEATRALQIYSLALIPLAFFSIFTIILRGEQRMDAYTLLNLAISLVQVGGAWFLMKTGSDVVALSILLLGVQILAALLAGVACFWIVPDFWKIWRFSLDGVLPVLRVAAPIALLTLLGMLYQKLSITMLSMMQGPTETGIFSAAARAVEASKTIHLAIFAALYPSMAQGLNQRPGREAVFDKVEIGYLKILLTGALLAACALFILAGPVVSLLYGANYAASVQILHILAWTLIPFSISGFLSLFLMALHKERLISLIMAVSLMGLAILSIWWIPLNGSVGAAWSFLAAECLQSSLLIAAVSPLYVKRKASHEFSEFPQ